MKSKDEEVKSSANMFVGKKSVISQKNSGCKRTVNTPQKHNKLKMKEDFSKLNDALENYPLFPEYYQMKSSPNRPHTAKIQRNEKGINLN